MNKDLKPYFTAAKKSGFNPEKNGLPSEKTIQKSVYLSSVKKSKK